MPGRIFISYSKAEPKPTQELADFLTAQGYTVWWDTNLTSGEVFREVIDRELAAADAVIVIWTAHSVASNWVVSEADDAARRNKLITLRTGDLEPWRIPKPYNTYHTDVVDNRDAVLAAVRRVAGKPSKPEVTLSPGLSKATLQEALALEHWKAIKASEDPSRLWAFLAEFGASKCGALARAEFARLAERDWNKLTNSNDLAALNGFCLLFRDTPQAKLALARMTALTSNIETKKHAWSTQNEFADFVNQHPIMTALLWLFIGSLLILIVIGICADNKISFIKLNTSLPRHEYFINGYLLGVFALILSEICIVVTRSYPALVIEVALYWLGDVFWLGFFGFVAYVNLGGSNGGLIFITMTIVSSILAWIWWNRTRSVTK